MTTEFAGAIDLEPPLTAEEIGYVRRLAKSQDLDRFAWTPARDGTSLRPRPGAGVEVCLESLRFLIATMVRPGRFHGTVAVFDTRTRELVAVTVSHGRVTRRVVRKAESRSRARSNVIDLAGRRRQVSRAIS